LLGYREVPYQFHQQLLEDWDMKKLHEAMVVLRVADSNPTALDTRRKNT